MNTSHKWRALINADVEDLSTAGDVVVRPATPPKHSTGFVCLFPILSNRRIENEAGEITVDKNVFDSSVTMQMSLADVPRGWEPTPAQIEEWRKQIDSERDGETRSVRGSRAYAMA